MGMRKIVILIALLAAVCILTSCRRKGEEKQPPASVAPTATPGVLKPTPARDETTSPALPADKYAAEKMTSTARFSTVEGKIVSEGGAPLASAEIALFHQIDTAQMLQPFTVDLLSSTTSLLAETDASGKFRLPSIAPGRYLLRIETSGYVPLFASGEIGVNWGLPQSDLEFTLGRRTPLRVHAIDEQAKSLANASVWIKGWTPKVWFICAGKTDDSGYFTTANVPQDAKYICLVVDPSVGYGFKGESTISGDSKSPNATVTVHPKTSLRGAVYDTAGQPVAGATIYPSISFKTKKTDQWSVELQPIATDASGSFQIPCPEGSQERNYSVSMCVIAKGLAAETRTIELNTKNPKEAEFRLQKGFSVSGTVSNRAGKPIAGVLIEAPGFRGLSSVTDHKGHFELSGLPGESASVRVRANGYADDTVTVQKSETAPVKVALTRGGSLAGRVYDKRTNLGVAAAKVSSPDHFNYEAPANAKGEYQLHFLRSVRQSIKASAEDYARAEVRDIEVADETLLRKVDFALVKGATISGRVLSSTDKKPITDAAVSLTSISNAYQKVETDAAGKYAIKNVPAGKPVVNAKAEGYIPGKGRALLCDGMTDIPNVDFVLILGATIEGKVTDKKGNALQGVVVGTQGGRFRRFGGGSLYNPTPTDAQGTYSISGIIPDNEFSAIARHEDYAEASLGPFRLKSGEKKSGVDFVLTAGGLISGKVTDENKKPIAAAELTYYKKTSDFFGADFGNLAQALAQGKFTKVEKDGTYQLKHLATGTYSVLARAEGYAYDMVSGTNVKEGEETKNVNFVLMPASTISGVVLDSNRKPVENAAVVAMAISLQKSYFANAQTEEDGSFTLKNLREGKYMLTVSAQDYPVYQKQNVPAPTSGLEIILESAGVLRGQVLDATSNRPVENFEVKLQYVSTPGLFGINPMAFDGRRNSREQFFSSEDGRFQFINLKPGTYNVTALSPDHAAGTKKGVKVSEGAAREDVIIYLEKGATVRGRVLAASDSSPISQAEVKVAGETTEMFGMNMDIFSDTTDAGTALTDDQGNYVLLHLPNGTQTLEAKKEGFLNAKKSVTIADGKDQEGVDILMNRGGAVTGRVLDMAKKEPVGDAQVFLAGQGIITDMIPEFGKSTTSDFGGRFTLENIESGKKTIKISHSSYSTKLVENVEIKEGERTDVGDILLSNGGMLKGTVSDSTGRPLSKFTITIMGPGGIKFASSNDKGEYQFENLAPGNYMVSAIQSPDMFTGGPPGQTQQRSADVKDGEIAEVNFEFTLGFRLFGVVTENGEPAEGLMVTYNAADLTRRITEGGSVMTDAKGNYEFRDVGPGAYNVMVSSGSMQPGSLFEQFLTRPTEITDHDVELNLDIPTSLIGGRVSDAETKEPLAGATVSLFAASSPRTIEDMIQSGVLGTRAVFTDEDGNYRFERVDKGPVTVVARQKNYAYETRTLTVTPGESTQDVDFALRPGLNIRGKALARETQRPVDKLFLLLEDQNRSIVYSDFVTVDSEGNYQIEGVRPGGYTLSAFPRDLAPIYNFALVVPEGNDAIVDLYFDLGGTLALTVLDEQGKGIQKAKVDLRDNAGRMLSLPPSFDSIMSYNDTFFTDDSGKLTRKFIPAGTYSVEIRAEGFQDKTVPSVVIQNKLTTEQSVTLTKK